MRVEYAKRISRKRPRRRICISATRFRGGGGGGRGFRLQTPSRREENFWEWRDTSRFLGNFAEKKYRIIFHSWIEFLPVIFLFSFLSLYLYSLLLFSQSGGVFKFCVTLHSKGNQSFLRVMQFGKNFLVIYELRKNRR